MLKLYQPDGHVLVQLVEDDDHKQVCSCGCEGGQQPRLKTEINTLVLRECFDIVGYDGLKTFDRANFEFLEIHRCSEGAEIGSRQLIFEF